ncbi:hypothetical protein D5400_12455 [Georhizobium profundi]|uniref:Uncharacterized protein n=1 Tax=Georhizobium profundi TaxID=2341112 RepID=A0A3Q8XP39_9HYPH|nr:hypothetical protein [Georhizobium profundi]AZN71977.1 hypothetical protein D5400_12455 [Georhizobium profundi]
MTAEIAIMNKTAIALAADSKVTLNVGGQQKTYDTVDKLFSLSKSEPMGAMIYGNAEFMGFPWETIIKEYRRRDPRKKFDTVFDWADDLLKFLTTFFSFSVEDERAFMRQLAGSTVRRVLGRWFEYQKQYGSADEDVMSDLLEELQTHIQEWEDEEDFLNDQEWASIQEAATNAINEWLGDQIFENEPALRTAAHRLAELSIRKLRPSPAHSGLVVAGFGEKELLPSLVAYEVDGILGGKLKCRKCANYDTTRVSTGMIRPFAQSDMVYRFMEGIDPAYAVELHESIYSLLLKNTVATAEAFGHSSEQIADNQEALESAVASAVESFMEESRKHRWEQYAQPIIDMAKMLPKDELAHMAESLVSLTSLQRRVSRDIETVGGAIDVAVISKGDGFVWIKRKHYFNPDRNLRFVSGYFSEYGATSKMDGGSDDDS